MELIREINDGVKINNPQAVYNNYLKEHGNQDREFLIVLGLDTRNKVIYKEIVSIGNLNSSIAGPREIFKKAVMMSSNAIIIAHNHPSQDLEPSEDDMRVYKHLKKCGEILQINVLDSIIFNKDTFVSLND